MCGTIIKEVLSNIRYLESLDLSYCSNFENYPEMVKTKCLKFLLLEETTKQDWIFGKFGNY